MTRMRVKVRGADAVQRMLSGQLPRDTERAARRAMFRSANAVRTDAVISVQRDRSIGRIYGHYFATINGYVVPVARRSRVHIASKPGDAPNTDTGRLVAGMGIDPRVTRKGQQTYALVSRAEYSGYLEFGTSRMAARPFMRPALRKNRKKILRIVRQEIRNAL